MDERVRVVPAPGKTSETARKLISLARDVQDVRTVNGGAEFSVPVYLADLYSKPRARRTKKGDEQ